MAAISITHTFVSTIDDDANTSLVRPSDWNAALSYTGELPLVNGGSGQSTQNAALNAFLPSQTGKSGQKLTTDGTNASWNADAGFLTIEQAFTSQTSVIVTHNNGYRPPVFVINSSSEELVPLDITHTSTSQFTVTFTSATTGTIVYGDSGASGGEDAFPTVTGVTEAYTILTTDGTIKCTGANSFTVTLPTAVGVSGQVYSIKVAGTGAITIDADGIEKIDDVESITIEAGTAGAYPSVTLQSDNVGWMII